ncbi:MULTISPECIES: ATP-binding protein [unclassified Pseudonocardia]|uniref:sensor histidine kinase n=1 Tax=unclassified Pseudonocardia TaxID=2619320 RepID=UPI00094AFDA0|nr:ATP-binding protein [Pseudonocardia sp. Ae707_Ps1]OLM20946.1 putative two-component system sensor kinase [Pseudonocardia sp. Ae707_Ps1]
MTGPRGRPGERVLVGGLTVVLVTAVAGGVLAGVHAVLVGAGLTLPVAAVVAAVPVAAGFLPLYTAARRLVDRAVRGDRPTPYGVLAGVTALSRSAPADTPDLAGAAEAVARGVGATTCRLTVHRSGLRDRAYTWTAAGTVAATGDALVRVPVRLGEEELGELAVDRAAARALRGEWATLLADIADGLAVAVHANRSAVELERQLRAALAHGERIAAARRDAVAAMDAERRRIERDLHDGAQHHLVSLGLSLGLVEHLVSAGRPEQARAGLDELLERVDAADAVLAETVGGVSSAVLAGQGLVAVLRDTLAGSEPPVTVEHDGVPAGRRYPDGIGDTAYFCCLEAVNNARKHAPGAPVTVTIAERDSTLRMAVRDEGPGFVPDPGPGSPRGQGRGLRNLTVRLVAVGGTVAVRSAPGAGTTVLWSLPLPPDREGVVDPEEPELPEHGADGRAGRAPDGFPTEVGELLRTGAGVYAGTPHAAALGATADALGRVPAGDRVARMRGARAALAALEEVLGTVRPVPRGADRLRYLVDRLRSEAHELVEAELAEALRGPGPVLPGELRASAERLLGMLGVAPRTRLGLPADAGADEVRRAAELELARWQRLAAHPSATGTVRDAAPVLVRTCERLLADRPG